MKESKPPSEDLIRLLAVHELSVGELALALRDLVLAEAPGVTELIYDVKYTVVITFSFTERFKESFCHIAVFSKHVNLGFNHGAELPDPDGLLQGSGKVFRHIKIASPADLRQPHVRHFIKLAVRQGKAAAKERAATVAKTVGKKPAGKKRRPHGL